MASKGDVSDDDRECMGLVSTYGFSPDYQVFYLKSEFVTKEQLFQSLLATRADQIKGVSFTGPANRPACDYQWVITVFVEGIQLYDSAPGEYHRGGSWHINGSNWIVTRWAQLAYRFSNLPQNRKLEGPFWLRVPNGGSETEPDEREYEMQLMAGQKTAIARIDPEDFDPSMLLS